MASSQVNLTADVAAYGAYVSKVMFNDLNNVVFEVFISCCERVIAGTKPVVTNKLFAPNVSTPKIKSAKGNAAVNAAPSRVSSILLAC